MSRNGFSVVCCINLKCTALIILAEFTNLEKYFGDFVKTVIRLGNLFGTFCCGTTSKRSICKCLVINIHELVCMLAVIGRFLVSFLQLSSFKASQQISEPFELRLFSKKFLFQKF